jgi:hypothetical protein
MAESAAGTIIEEVSETAGTIGPAVYARVSERYCITWLD